jgi:hypothetical protein
MIWFLHDVVITNSHHVKGENNIVTKQIAFA